MTSKSRPGRGEHHVFFMFDSDYTVDDIFTYDTSETDKKQLG